MHCPVWLMGMTQFLVLVCSALCGSLIPSVCVCVRSSSAVSDLTRLRLTLLFGEC